MINLIVTGVSAFALLFVILWIFVPKFRASVERPKYRMLDSERRYRQNGR
jgi:hypothetical protein